jgi:hypothetical protein
VSRSPDTDTATASSPVMPTTILKSAGNTENAPSGRPAHHRPTPLSYPPD